MEGRRRGRLRLRLRLRKNGIIAQGRLAFGRVSRSLFWHRSQTDERIHESMSIGGECAVEGLRQLQATYGQASHRPLLAAR